MEKITAIYQDPRNKKKPYAFTIKKAGGFTETFRFIHPEAAEKQRAALLKAAA